MSTKPSWHLLFTRIIQICLWKRFAGFPSLTRLPQWATSRVWNPSPNPLWLWNLTFWTSPIFFFTLFLGVGRTVKWEGNWSTIDHNQIGLVHQKGQENVCDQGKRNHSWFLLITKVTRSGFYHYLKGVFAEDILVSCLHFPGFQNSSNDNIHLSDCLGNILFSYTYFSGKSEFTFEYMLLLAAKGSPSFRKVVVPLPPHARIKVS